MENYVTLFVLMTMIFLAASLSALIGFGVAKADLGREEKQRFVFWLVTVIATWITMVAILAYTEVLVPRASQRIPTLGILILASAIVGSYVSIRNKTAQAVIGAIPAHTLATIQVYRIVGIVFLFLASDGILSDYFAQTTGWGDILVGITAPIIGYLLWKDAAKYKILAALWCVLGIGDLLLVLFKAIRSAPGPMQLPNIEIETVIVGQFPFLFIPLIVVPISLILHAQLLSTLFTTKAE